MKAIEYGKANERTIMLLHGGGLSYWNYRKEAESLAKDFHLILPILSGHSDSGESFTSIEDNAREILSYIDQNCEGKLLVLGGLSLGAQIAVEMICQRNDVAERLIIESAALLPDKLTNALIKPALASSYWLIRKRWFAKWQFKSLKIREDFFEDYYRDSCQIAKSDMIAFLKANSSYEAKEQLKECQVKTRIIVGGKENKRMKESAKLLKSFLPNSVLEIKEGLHHGEYSLNHPDEYAKDLLAFV